MKNKIIFCLMLGLSSFAVANENEDSKKEESVMYKQVGSARDQGFQVEMSQEDLADLRNSVEQATNARQQGIQVTVPTEANPVLKDASHRMWLQNWSYVLEDVGVSPEKTYFEAGRLNKVDFENWANETYQKYKK